MSYQGIIDVQAGLKNVANNEALFRKVLTRFTDQQGSAITDMQNALAAQDHELAHRLAHTLKGLAATIGAMQLHAAALEVEQPMKNALQPSPEQLDTLRQELNSTLAAIAEILATPTL